LIDLVKALEPVRTPKPQDITGRESRKSALSVFELDLSFSGPGVRSVERRRLIIVIADPFALGFTPALDIESHSKIP
jgi:hypothetical protein